LSSNDDIHNEEVVIMLREIFIFWKMLNLLVASINISPFQLKTNFWTERGQKT